jgi:hypothetical protein
MANPINLTITRDDVAKVLREVRALTEQQVVVGFPEKTADRGEDINNPSLAYIHENGYPPHNLPARPFLMHGVENAMDQIVAVFEKGARNALDGNAGALVGTLNVVGNIGQGAVRNKIRTGPFAKHADSTLDRRKAANAKRSNVKSTVAHSILVDTGAMLDAVSFEVRRKSGTGDGTA